MLLPLLVLLFTSCEHKELCEIHPHVQTLRLIYDWRDAPEACPDGMVVYFYPIQDFSDDRADEVSTQPGTYYVFQLSPYGGKLRGIAPGKYRVITYNNDTSGVLFANGDQWHTHTGFTREGSLLEPIYGNATNRAPHAPGADDQRVLICPDEMWGCSVMDVEITEQGISYLHFPFDPGANVDTSRPVVNDNHVITLYPHPLTCYYDYEIRNVSELDNAVQMCASLSGMAPQINFSSEELGREPVSIPFEANPKVQFKKIIGDFITWGHHEENEQRHYLMLYVWMKGEPKGWAYSMDVTDQVHSAPDKRHVHLVVDHLDLPKIIPPDGDGAFKASLDDWDTELVDIKM